PARKRLALAVPHGEEGEEGNREREPPEAGRNRPDMADVLSKSHHPGARREEQICKDQRGESESGDGVMHFDLQPLYPFAPAANRDRSPPMPSLFDPIKLGALEVPNRILLAPLTRGRATRAHVPTPLMQTYYAQRAGAGLILHPAT